MTVLMAHTSLGVQKRPTASYDGQGNPLLSGPGEITGPFPGRARKVEDGSWHFGLDPALWPVTEGDLIVEFPSKRRWYVTSAEVLRNTLDPLVDYIRAEGHERTPEGTEPAGGTNPRGV